MVHVDGVEFVCNLAPATASLCVPSSDGTRFLKFRRVHGAGRRNSIEQEADILEEVGRRGAVCAPRLTYRGPLDGGYCYVATFATDVAGQAGVDVLLAALELKGLGIVHGDLVSRGDNTRFNGVHTVLVDYDQAVLDDSVRGMTVPEWFAHSEARRAEPPYKMCYTIAQQFARLGFASTDGRLDLRGAHFFGAHKRSTDTSDGIYHPIDGRCIWVKGERGLGRRKEVLDALSFERTRVLDVGCNTGLFARYAAGRGAAAVLGLEVVREAALLGEVVNHVEDFRNCTIAHHDATTGLVRSYDTVAFLSSLHHIEHANKAIEDAAAAERVIVEARPNEVGAVYDRGGDRFRYAQKWSVGSHDDLERMLSTMFKRPMRRIGDVDRGRAIYVGTRIS